MIPPTSHDDTTLVLRRVFIAPRQRVFRAWIDPKALVLWLRPGGMHITVQALNAHVGGSFRFDLENGHSILGTYLQIVPPEKLVFTWSGDTILGWETIVTLDFLDLGSATEVVLTHERLNTPELRALFSSGWLPMLNRLTGVLSSSLDF